MCCPDAVYTKIYQGLLCCLLLCCLAFLPGCATKQDGDDLFSVVAEDANALDDYDMAPRQAIADPLEKWNRFWFGFNDIFYLHVARPVYNAYAYVMPTEFQAGLKNFFHNLLFPVRFVNNILQGKFGAAMVEFGKFIVNTTIGFGFFDITKDRAVYVEGYDPQGADFGQTLGVWGFKQGPYLMWPFIGPSSLRETVGLIGDYPLNPSIFLYSWELSVAAATGRQFTHLGSVLPLYENLKGASVDPYIAMREAYAEYRKRRVSGATALPASPRPPAED